MKEGNGVPYILDDVEPGTFDAFVLWMFTGRLYKPKEPALATDATGETTERSTNVNMSQASIAKVWLLGDRLGVPPLQNLAIDTYHQHIHDIWKTDRDMIPYVWNNTVKGHKLRSFLIELFSTVATLKKDESDTRFHEMDFLIELVERQEELSAHTIISKPTDFKNYWAKLDLCQFHIHDQVDCKKRAVGIGLEPAKPITKQ